MSNFFKHYGPVKLNCIIYFPANKTKFKIIFTMYVPGFLLKLYH